MLVDDEIVDDNEEKVDGYICIVWLKILIEQHRATYHQFRMHDGVRIRVNCCGEGDRRSGTRVTTTKHQRYNHSFQSITSKLQMVKSS